MRLKESPKSMNIVPAIVERHIYEV